MDADESPRRVLHAARLVGLASIDQLVDRSGLDRVQLQVSLDRCAAQGWIRFREGRVSGWMLTPEGRDRVQRLLVDELDSTGGFEVVERRYSDFVRLNPVLLALCTDWQLRPQPGPSAPDARSLNDHSDRDYDAAVIGRLVELHEATLPILGEISTALSRFAGYVPRLRNALARVQDGDRDWFTRPVIDSYHTIWFELHEDLLATLGLERSGERS